MSESNQSEQEQPNQEQTEQNQPEQSEQERQIQQHLNEIEVLITEYEDQLSTLEDFHDRYWHKYNQQILRQRFEELKAEIGTEAQAIDTTKPDIDFDYKFAKIYNLRGGAYCSLKNYEQALEDCNKAIMLAPDYAQAYFDRGNVYVGLKDYQRAVEEFSHAIVLDASLFLAYINRGTSYSHLGQNQLAIQEYSQAIALKPDDPALYKFRAAVYLKIGEYQKVIEDYTRVIELDSQDAEIYCGRAFRYVFQSNYKKAAADFEQAVRLGFSSPEMYYWRGNTYYNLKNYPQAIEDYNRAIELKPDHAEAYYNRGAAKLLLKQRKPGRADFRQSRTIRLTIPPSFVVRFNWLRQVRWQIIFNFILVYAGIVIFANVTTLNKSTELTTNNLFNKAGNDSLAHWILGWPILVWGIIFRLGKLKPADIGLNKAQFKSGLLVTFFLWLIPELLALIFNSNLRSQYNIWPYWVRYNLITTLSNFLFYIIPSVGLTLVAFHGFLLPQLHQKFSGRWRLLNAMTISQTLFALSYLPSWLNRPSLSSSPTNDLNFDLLTFFLIGMFLAMVYLRTNNLFLCIGVYALVKEPLSLFIPDSNHSTWIIFLLIFVILCWPVGAYNGIHYMVVDDLTHPDWTPSLTNFGRSPKRFILLLTGLATSLIIITVVELGFKLRIAGPFFFVVLWIPAFIQIMRLLLRPFLGENRIAGDIKNDA